MIYECGDKYNGEWKENLMDGNGIFTYISGSYYNGFWNKGKKMEKEFFIILMVHFMMESGKMIKKKVMGK